MSSAGEGFTELEAQVHEMRRKLRWLSIYPQALQGLIQLNDGAATNPALQKYLTPEIVNSPFNKMPPPGMNTSFLLLEKNYFLALSWMISALGTLKDDGLRIVAVTEAIQQTEGISHEAACEKALGILGADSTALQQVLDKSTAICKTFFEENIPDKLISGISSKK